VTKEEAVEVLLSSREAQACAACAGKGGTPRVVHQVHDELMMDSGDPCPACGGWGLSERARQARDLLAVPPSPSPYHRSLRDYAREYAKVFDLGLQHRRLYSVDVSSPLPGWGPPKE